MQNLIFTWPLDDKLLIDKTVFCSEQKCQALMPSPLLVTPISRFSRHLLFRGIFLKKVQIFSPGQTIDREQFHENI